MSDSTPQMSGDLPLGFRRNIDIDVAPQRCVVLVPFQGRIVSQCQAGLIELERRGYTVRRVEGYSAIDQARNQLASDALADGFQETFWIDSDVGFRPDDVARIRNHGLPISCGIYPKKGKRELAIHIIPGTPSFQFGGQGGLNELLYCGAGFLHVRRIVYETMIEKLALPRCNEHVGRPLRPFFQPLVRTAPRKALNQEAEAAPLADTSRAPGHWYLAEDYAFCHRARECGFAIVADTTIRLWHVGDYAYS
jgi:hypothetical protein